MNNPIGTIVLAEAGRDQDGLFFVVGESEGFLHIADGKRRKLSHPKRKNPQHLRIVLAEDFEDPVMEKLKQGKPVSDRELRRALAAFKEGNTRGER